LKRVKTSRSSSPCCTNCPKAKSLVNIDLSVSQLLARLRYPVLAKTVDISVQNVDYLFPLPLPTSFGFSHTRHNIPPPFCTKEDILLFVPQSVLDGFLKLFQSLIACRGGQLWESLPGGIGCKWTGSVDGEIGRRSPAKLGSDGRECCV